MWHLLNTFGLVSATTALGSLLILATVLAMRRQQIQLFRLGYYKRKTRVLKPLHWKAVPWLLCLLSVLLGCWEPKLGLLVLGIGLLTMALWLLNARQREALSQLDAVVSYLSGLEGLIRGGVSFPMALQKLSIIGQSVIQTKVRRAFRRFSSGASFSSVLASVSVTDFMGLMQRAHRLGLPMLPIIEMFRQSLEGQALQDKRVFGIRNQAVVNGLISFSLPWIVFVFLCFQQPGMSQRIFSSSTFGLVVAVASALQIAGIVVIWRLSTFSEGKAKTLFEFIQALHLYLRSGFSLHWSWKSLTQRQGCEGFRPINETDTIEACLARLAKDYALPGQRHWFGILRELYVEGSDLAPLLQSMIQSLEQDRSRAVAAFLEMLPVRVNVVGIVFFFPAFFALSILPLVIEIMGDL